MLGHHFRFAGSTRCRTIIIMFIGIHIARTLTDADAALWLQLPGWNGWWHHRARELFTEKYFCLDKIRFVAAYEWFEATNRFNKSPLIASKSFLNETISRCSMWSLLLLLRNSSLICFISMVNDWTVFSTFLSNLSMASVITSLSSFLRPNNSGSMYC